MPSIIPIKAFNDNYIWCLEHEGQALVVDPGDPLPVEQYLKNNNLTLKAILITHHHNDHTGGLLALKEHWQCPVYGPEKEAISGVDIPLSEGDEVRLNWLTGSFRIFDIPGHTRGHIAYYCESTSVLFCGDTLFSAGCGRLFEGTPEQMHASLSKLKQLPDNTEVYCTHEYTLANLKFAVEVEPENAALHKRLEEVTELRQSDEASLPSTLKIEREINPFLRVDNDSVKQAAEKYSGETASSPEQVFAVIRRWKDSF